MKHQNFTIYHGFAGSLGLHAAAALLLVLALGYAEQDVDDTLVVEFQGVDSDIQAEEKVREQNRGAGAAVEAQSQKAGSTDADERKEAPPPLPDQDALPDDVKDKEKGGVSAAAASSAAGQADLQGADEEQRAQMIQRRAEEQMNLLKAYVKGLSKKVQSKLVYPKEVRHAGFQGVATVSFRILHDGGVEPESLKIVASSGKAEVDASALTTIRACAPFAPPPREITVTMAVTYGRKR